MESKRQRTTQDINQNYLYTAKAYYNKSIALSKLGSYKKTIKCYNTSTELTPNYADAYHNKDITYF